MLSIEEALSKIMKHIRVLEPEEKDIEHCLGQVLSEDIFAPMDVPRFPLSAMDGYAIRSEDTERAPVVLKVIEEIKAGDFPKKKLSPGTCARVMTGAPIPPGADAVVKFELTDEEERLKRGKSLSEIKVLRRIERGEDVREVGEDVKRGELVLRKGSVLRPQDIGMLASLGIRRCRVIRRPIVSIISTGDEIVEPGEELPPGKVYNANAYSLFSLVSKYGGIPRIIGTLPDREEDIKRGINEALSSDLIITTAGVSVGEYDIVKKVMMDMGRLELWSVRMKPGKPFAFGIMGERKVPLLGLPGYPVSTIISFEVFARPVILKMMGKKAPEKPKIKAISKSNIKNKDGRRVFARVYLEREGDRWFATLSGHQGSGNLSSLVRASGLMIIPEDVPEVREGDEVDVEIMEEEWLFSYT